MRLKYTLLLFTFIYATFGFGQSKILVNAWAEGELSNAGPDSHYYYNEIHKNNTGWDVGLNNINTLLTAEINPQLTLNLRAQLSRQKGDLFNNLGLPLANLKYQFKKKDLSISLGRFITAFGSFSKLQHPKERTFINLPLSYSYYVNVSSNVGYHNQIGQDSFIIDESVDWGSTLIYYGGYSDGVLFDWSPVPDKINVKLALTNHAINIFNKKKIMFTNYGISGRLELQPKYYWKQGVSISTGTFLFNPYGKNPLGDQNLKQTLIGTDCQLGFGFWEITGEFITALYKVPVHSLEGETAIEEAQNLYSISANINLKYEVPIISGLYAAYGFDFLSFSKYDRLEIDDSKRWDDNVLRHQFALGYKINNFLLLRTNFLLQPIKKDPNNIYETYNQNTWRTSLTVYF